MRQIHLSIPLWTLIPAALLCASVFFATRKTGNWDFLTPTASLACLGGALLFLLGRCF